MSDNAQNDESLGRWIEYRDHHNHLIKRVFEDAKGMQIIIQSKFVKAKIDVNEGDVCTIKTEGLLVPTPDGKKKVYQFEVELMNGNQKTVTFNNQSLRNIMLAYGTESNKWVGKQVVVQDIVKIQAFGKVMDSIVWNVVGATLEPETEV